MPIYIYTYICIYILLGSYFQLVGSSLDQFYNQICEFDLLPLRKGRFDLLCVSSCISSVPGGPRMGGGRCVTCCTEPIARSPGYPVGPYLGMQRLSHGVNHSPFGFPGVCSNRYCKDRAHVPVTSKHISLKTVVQRKTTLPPATKKEENK